MKVEDSTSALIPGSPGWHVRVVNVTPELATVILDGNAGNRRLRHGTVERYAVTMAEGGWKLTPEAVTIANDGRLINGQHRLHAVIKSGVCCQMTMVSGTGHEFFSALDRGALRTVADALQRDRFLMEVANTALRILYVGRQNTDARAEEMAKILAAPHALLREATTTTSRVFTSAPFRLAACVRMMEPKADIAYILGTYTNLALGHVSKLDVLPQSAVGAMLAGRWTSGGSGPSVQADNMARAWDVFDVAKRDNHRLIIKSLENRKDEMIRVIEQARA